MISYHRFEVSAVNAEEAVVIALAEFFRKRPETRDDRFTSKAKLLGPGRFAVILEHHT